MSSKILEGGFEPFCKWQRKKKYDVYEVHLHGFRRDDIQFSVALRTLKIGGARFTDENTKQHFSREIKLSNVYDKHKITSEFSGGIFSITLPKKTPSWLSTLCSSSMKKLGLIDDVNPENYRVEMTWKVLVVVALAAFMCCLNCLWKIIN